MSGFDEIRLKFTAIGPLKYGANAAAEFDEPSWPRFVRITDVDANGQLREDTFRSLPPELAEPFRLQVGDILLARSGATVGKTFIYKESWGDACYAGYLVRLRTSDNFFARYVYWCLQSSKYWADVESNLIQSTIQNVNAERYANFRVPSPPLETQHSIAHFLDEKTARIDALIEKKRALLDRLAEKRQALITRAVTKGLNPDTPVKSTGIDWLGDIPAHWEVRRVKELGLLIGGAGFPHDYQGEKGLPLVFLKVADLGRVVQSEKLVSAENSIAYETAKALGATIIRPGDVVFAKVGAALLLNRFRCIGVDCCIDNNMMAFRPNTLISTDFALASFSRINFSDIVNPGAVPSVNGGQVGRIQIALPQKSEQNQIVRYLTNRFSDIEFSEKRIQGSIDMLIEYRSALITAAVTGQLEVP